MEVLLDYLFMPAMSTQFPVLGANPPNHVTETASRGDLGEVAYDYRNLWARKKTKQAVASPR